MARKQKRKIVKPIDMQVHNIGNTLCTISYLKKDGEYTTINITPMESVTIPEEYKNTLIKFINQGLIKIL